MTRGSRPRWAKPAARRIPVAPPSRKASWSLFIALPTPARRRRYILIDALDEALAVREGLSIVNLLSPSRLDRLPGWLRVVATTRPEPEVLRRLSGLRAEQVRADAPDNLDDIERFLAHRLGQPGPRERVGGEPPSRRGRDRDALRDRSGGNFLWTEQALVGLESGSYDFAHLEALPPGLTGLYTEFFERHFPDASSFASARQVLEVVTAARELLTPAEIASATGLDPDYELPAWLDRLAAYLPDRDGRRGVYHKSFSDWLTDAGHPRPAGRFFVSPRRGHERLAAWCWAEYQARAGAYVPLRSASPPRPSGRVRPLGRPGGPAPRPGLPGSQGRVRPSGRPGHGLHPGPSRPLPDRPPRPPPPTADRAGPPLRPPLSGSPSHRALPVPLEPLLVVRLPRRPPLTPTRPRRLAIPKGRPEPAPSPSGSPPCWSPWRSAREGRIPSVPWLLPPPAPVPSRRSPALLPPRPRGDPSCAWPSPPTAGVSPAGRWTGRSGSGMPSAAAELLPAAAGMTGRVTSVAFAPDGRRIVSGSEDQTGRVWDAETGAQLARLRGHAEQGPERRLRPRRTTHRQRVARQDGAGLGR